MTMQYTKDYGVNFEYWGGAAARVASIRERWGYSGVAALVDYVEGVFDGYAPSETGINDLVWFDLTCYEDAHGNPAFFIGEPEDDQADGMRCIF